MGTQFIRGLVNFLKLSGGTMTGDIDMGDNAISDAKSIGFNDGGAIESMINDSAFATGVDSKSTSSSLSIKAYVDIVPKSNAYSTTLIKVMPTEFMMDDVYTRASHVLDNDTSLTLGYRHSHTSTVSHAFVHIPNGYMATHCIVRTSTSTVDAVTCFTYNLRTGAIVALASGDFDFNSIEDISDVTATTTNDLVIRISPASISTLIFGAEVTIAAV